MLARVVFFHPELVHGSGQNRLAVGAEDGFRAAIATHFVRADLSRYQPSGAPIWAEVPLGKAVIDADTVEDQRKYAEMPNAKQAGVSVGSGEAGDARRRFEMAEESARNSIENTHQLVWRKG